MVLRCLQSYIQPSSRKENGGMIAAAHNTMLNDGKTMRCAVFDGLATSKMMASAVTINPVQQPQISIATWIRCLDYAGSAVRCISLYDNANNKKTGPQFAVANETTGVFDLIFQWVSGFDVYYTGDNLGEWHHYAFSFKPGSLKRYYNGLLVKTDTNATTWLRDNTTANLVLTIGASLTNTTSTIVGQIANVNLFDYELSAQEVAFLASKPSAIPTTAYHQYLFAENDGTDTGTATSKWNLSVGSTTTFDKVKKNG